MGGYVRIYAAWYIVHSIDKQVSCIVYIAVTIIHRYSIVAILSFYIHVDKGMTSTSTATFFTVKYGGKSSLSIIQHATPTTVSNAMD